MEDTRPDRSSLIQEVARKRKCKSYLEIGVAQGWVFDKVQSQYKLGVDPGIDYKSNVFQMTSDNFFEKLNVACPKFDLIFIDGCHKFDYVARDIQNCLRYASHDKTAIFIHDMNPWSFEETDWQTIRGDGFRVWDWLRQDNMVDMYSSIIHDNDTMSVVIKKPHLNYDNYVVRYSNMTYEEFDRKRDEQLNLVDWKELVELCL